MSVPCSRSARRRRTSFVDSAPEPHPPVQPGGAAVVEREQKRKSTPTEREEDVEEAPATSERGEELKAELDDLLDEIDEVLEENAEEFVKNYVQKGGQ